MTVDDKVTAPALTKQDEVFEAAGCQFVWGMEGLTVEDLNALFRNVSYLPQSHEANLAISSGLQLHQLWVKSQLFKTSSTA